jgi:hypothetical protein
MERYRCERVRVRATKPEPPLPMAIESVSVEVLVERPLEPPEGDEEE